MICHVVTWGEVLFVSFYFLFIFFPPNLLVTLFTWTICFFEVVDSCAA